VKTVFLTLPWLALSGCPRGGNDQVLDASADSGVEWDACRAQCGGEDSGTDAGDSGAAKDPLATGGCREILTAELSNVPDHTYSWNRIVGASGHFFITSFREIGDDASECLFLALDRDGVLVDRTEVDVDDGLCGARLISDDGSVLRFQQDRVWVGSLDGSGQWLVQESSGGHATNLGEDGVLLSDGEGWLTRYDWQGTLIASYELWLGQGIISMEPATVGWSGSVIAVAFRNIDADSGLERVYFQRFDVDLVPLDPEPILVLELDLFAGMPEFLHADSPLLVGWDGTEFGVVVTWIEDFSDFWDAHTDVFRFGEQGEVHGGFSVDEPPVPAPDGYEGYTAGQLLEVFSVPEAGRLVVSSLADYWAPDRGGYEWTGVHFAPIELATGERAGEDARLWIDWFNADMARLGGRVGILWAQRENLNEDRTEFIRHLMFTVLDCSEAMGVP
jgi:hypothetical protein